MKRHVWLIDPPYWINPMEHGRQIVYSSNYAGVYYVWKGRPANIHAAAFIARRYFWEDVKKWLLMKWEDGSAAVWFIKIFGVLFLLVAMLVIAFEATML